MKSEIIRFDQLMVNVRQATTRAGYPRRATRPEEINALTVKRLRGWTRLSQPESTGPARALLRAICNDPEHVLRALRASGPRRGPALRRREAAA